ncbi:MAG: aminotransferase class V-fold PLP-dependent enzyme [Oscillospiraceae bacterium]
MLYFDNAATTYPKPYEVRKAVNSSFLYYGANPGRSGHSLAMDTAREVFKCRERAAKLFGCAFPENVIFTKNCTEAINLVIMSIVPGGHCVISDLEHNSVLRPLHYLKNKGEADFSVAKVYEGDTDSTLMSFKNAIRKNTKLVAVTGASNVFGVKPPIKELAALAHEHGVLFMLDAAQTAGSEKYDMEKDNIDFICAPGHKGLMGPMGTGLLVAKNPELLHPLLFGGTGTYSLEARQPDMIPEGLESGTINVPGICGLSAGISRVMREGEEKIAAREMKIAQFIYSELAKMKNIRLFTQYPSKGTHAPVISFVIGDLTGERTAELISQRGIATRGGFHCAALAHRKFATDKIGTCRISVGPMNTMNEAAKLVKIIYSVSENIYSQNNS